jgi:hypothetical protein
MVHGQRQLFIGRLAYEVISQGDELARPVVDDFDVRLLGILNPNIVGQRPQVSDGPVKVNSMRPL